MSIDDDERSWRLDDAAAFWELLDRADVEFSYNSMLAHHMSHHFPLEWPQLQCRLLHCAIPLTRADGRHRADASIMGGGRYGGTLRSLLELDHDTKIREAARIIHAAPKTYDRRRRKEHDYEHIESALEIDAAFFITTDYRLLRRLASLPPARTITRAVNRAREIAVRPSHALRVIRGDNFSQRDTEIEGRML